MTDVVDFQAYTVNNIAFTISGTWNNNPSNTGTTGFQRVDSLTLNSATINDYGQNGSWGAILASGTVTVTGTSTYNQLGGGVGLGLLGTTVNVPGSGDQFIVNGLLRNTQAGTGSLTKTGAGAMVVGGTGGGYTGATGINAGTLQIGTGGTTGFIGSTSGVSVASGAQLVFNRIDNYGGNFTPAISGSGGVTLSTGTLTLTGNNPNSGATVISGGMMQVGSGATAGSIGQSSGVSVASGAQLVFNRSDS